MRFILNLSLILTIASCNVTNNQTEESFSILSDLEGKSFDLNLYEGNVIILNIWATWCKPCIAEFESLEKDWISICNSINIDHQPLPCVGKASNNRFDNYQKYYNSNTKKIIEDKFEEDIEYFKYTF